MKNNCQCAELISQLIKRFESFELTHTNKIINDFDIDTFKKASKILLCSVSTLRKGIEDGILIKDVHYRFNGRKKYIFSNSALLNIKGTL